MAKTSMGVREMRSRLVYEELLAQPERFLTREAVARLPRFIRWRQDAMAAALADLTEQGLLVETLDGKLAITPRVG